MLVLAASAWGAKIAGTPRNDVLRGTSAADVLDGRGGNDRLYGLGGNDRLIGGAGNDRLVGGAGADRLSCGRGNDIAYGDNADTIASDCERMVVGPPPAIGPEHTPYLGTTSQGKRIGFDGDAAAFRNLALRIDASCTGAIVAQLFNLPVKLAGPFAVARDGSFSGTIAPAGDGLMVGGSISGSFARDGGASGTIEVTAAVDASSRCSSGPLSWTARPTADRVVPGAYSGVTRQRKSVKFSVADGRVVDVEVGYTAPCEPSGTYQSTFTWNGPFAIDEARTFTATGTSSDGRLMLTLTGTFDAAGDADGTFQARVRVEQDGVRYECDTGTVAWSAVAG